jgi:hypothetical protein
VGVGPHNLRLDQAWRKRLIVGLLKGQQPDGSFGVHPYSKWTGAHWRLVSLVELGVPSADRRARAAADTVLGWVGDPSRPMGFGPRSTLVLAGKERRHASIEGNALAVCCRLGMARDQRVSRLTDVLLRSQWPDGGWNCDRDPKAHRSSFHESLAPIWGLFEYHRATSDRDALDAAHRACELLLSHHMFRSMATGKPIHPEWLRIHWPHYWHYDFFQGLRMVALLGRLDDPRAADALDVLRARKRVDGTWRVDGRRHWRSHGARSLNEAVNWGDARRIVTPYALALLKQPARRA